MDSMSSDEASNKPTASGAAEIPPISDEERRAREAFISTKRHDLRTPINTIIGSWPLSSAPDAAMNGMVALVGSSVEYVPKHRSLPIVTSSRKDMVF